MGVRLARAASKTQTCVLLIVCGVHCVESRHTPHAQTWLCNLLLSNNLVCHICTINLSQVRLRHSLMMYCAVKYRAMCMYLYVFLHHNLQHHSVRLAVYCGPFNSN